MFATHARRHIMCEAHIITVGNIICPTGQTSFKKRQNSVEFCRFLLVELRGVEPLSENNLTGLSSGAVCYLHSLAEAGTNTLDGLVASLCMVRAKLNVLMFTTQITPCTRLVVLPGRMGA